jgi:hypothetical protein
MASDLNIGIDYTIELWTNCGVLADNNRDVLILATDSPAIRTALRVNHNQTAGKLRWQAFNTSAGTFGISDITVSSFNWADSAWHHIALVHDTSANDGQARLYLDGVDKGLLSPADNNTINSGVDRMYFGGPSVNTPGCKVTEFRKWSTARSTSQIQNHWQCQLSCVDDSSCTGITGLDWYVPFTEGTSTAANDNAGSADFTLSSAGLWDSSIPAYVNDGTNNCSAGPE